MKIKTLFVFFIALISSARGQSTATSFRKLSRPEKCWVIAHPFIAKKAWHCTQRVRAVTDSIEKAGVLADGNGGHLDAFRHAYWMASLVQEISPRKAMKLGKAHEKGNYLDWKKGKNEDAGSRADSMSCVMDLQNNESGIAIGKKFRCDTASAKTLIREVLDSDANGNLVMLKKDESGNFYTCDGKPIDLTMYDKAWFIPKCLVKTSEPVKRR